MEAATLLYRGKHIETGDTFGPNSVACKGFYTRKSNAKELVDIYNSSLVRQGKPESYIVVTYEVKEIMEDSIESK